MTEDEAKTKWCPFARIAQQGPWGASTINRPPTHSALLAQFDPPVLAGELLPSTCCIASACMAWRETQPASDPLRYDDGTAGGRIEYATPAQGVCGLAGAPI